MDKLPREIINKIMWFVSHPIAEIFKIELEAAEKQIKHDRKLRHVMIKQLETEYYLTHPNIYCDCCANLWNDCYCLCSNCHGNYRDCCYHCYNQEGGLTTWWNQN